MPPVHPAIVHFPIALVTLSVVADQGEAFIYLFGETSIISERIARELARYGHVQRVRVTDESLMCHPMQLHGHSFRILTENGQGGAPPLKDTVIVEPRRALAFEFLADNPGDWLFHCHHAYHLAAGMARVFNYV